MKKTILSFLCVIVLMMCAFGVTGCSRSVYLYENCDNFLVGGTTLEDITLSSIDIDWVCGSVEVEISSETENLVIEESYSKQLKDEEKLRYLLDETGSLIIKFRQSTNQKVNLDIKKSLIIKVPATLASANKINISTESASVKIKGQNIISSCNIAEINIKSSSGEVVVGGLNASSLKAESVSGNVSINTCLITNVEINTTSGGLYTQDLICIQLNLSTISGASKCKFSTAPSLIYVKSTSGSNEVQLPETIEGYEVEFTTKSGRYSSEFFEKAESGKRIYGENISCRLHFETVSASVAIKKYVS